MTWGPISTHMKVWKRRVINTVVAITLLIVVSSLIYHYIMLYVEGLDPDIAEKGALAQYLHSLQVVVETYTGTGYGSDSAWETPVANLFVSAMDLSTFLLLFIILPYVFRPVLDAVLSPDVPRHTDLSDHTVVCDITERTERLVEEFESRNADYVVLHEEGDRALELLEQGVDVVEGEPSSAEALRRANVDEASSVVVDTEDSESASVVLAVREVDADVPVTVLVRDLSLEKYLRYAGATSVLTPRHLLGRRIAERVDAEIDPGLSHSAPLTEGYVAAEVTVLEESIDCGRRLDEVEVFEEPTVDVPAMWRDGEFVGSPPAETTVEAHDQLLVVGREDDVRRAEEVLHPGDRVPRILVAGFGEVGSTVSDSLRIRGIHCTVLDLEEKEGVDIVGDATDEDVLVEAGIEDATVLVSTVQDDDEAILSVLVARELAGELEIIARVNDGDNENKIRRAGADYVLSLPEISGRMLAEEGLQDDVYPVDSNVRMIEVDGSEYMGREHGELSLTDEGCVVAAVLRDGDVVVDIPADFVFSEDDVVYVSGDEASLEELRSEPGSGS